MHPELIHHKSIHSSLEMLYHELGNAIIAKYCNSLHRESLLGQGGHPIIKIQRYAKIMVEHYGISIGAVVVSLRKMAKVAEVELSASSDFFIEVGEQFVDHEDDLLAVLAHEITHIFLHRHRLAFPDTLENEILTDTAATYLGLGTLILNGYSENQRIIDKNTEERTTKWYGYLTPLEYGYILAKRARRFADNPAPYLKGNSSSFYHSGSQLLEKEYRAAPFEGAHWSDRVRYLWQRKQAKGQFRTRKQNRIYFDEFGYGFEDGKEVHLILKCLSCFQKLRVPAHRGPLTLRCPICGDAYKCET